MTAPDDAETFPKRARIRRRSEYVRIQRTGERRHGQYFVVLKSPSATDHVRVGITVSSKVGNAVVRNRIKRTVREIVRRCWRSGSPGDFVIVAKPAAATITPTAAQAELDKICAWRD